MNMDPLAENYYSISSYTYVANNPVRYIDPTGMKIEDPDGIVSKQKKLIESTNVDIKNFMKNNLMSEELGNKLLSANDRILKEIKSLEKSDQVYNVYSVTGESGSGVGYDKNTDKVMIGIKGDNYGLVAHELKHGYQFEKGKVSLLTDNSGYGSLYDLSDETESYNDDRYIKSGRDYFENPSIKWNNDNVLTFGKTMIPPAYQGLPTGPIDINSKDGKDLRKITFEAGRNQQAVQEVYIGWKKDYAKGAKANKK